MPNIKISYKNALTQFVQIEFSFNSGDKTYLELQLAAWRPGRYELMNYVQFLRKMECLTPNVTLNKVTKDRWSIACPENTQITLCYEYHAKTMDAGSSYLDNYQLYINPINCIPELVGLAESYSIDLKIPADYKIATSLSINNNTLEAVDYQELCDSPFIASSRLVKESFVVADTQFHIWVCGNVQTIDPKLVEHYKQYTHEQIALFGEFPCDEYHYLIQAPSYKYYHGVEHKKSTVIVVGPVSDLFNERYDDLLGVSSHELFHAWNVCRIRNTEMVPYNFSSETYFDTGYILEGITTYYGDYMLGRSGVFTTDQFFKEFDLYLQRHFNNSGRHYANLADSSKELWADGYKLGSPGRKVSIYIKGALISFIADVTIRKASQNRKCLDDVMRLMWAKHGKQGIGYSTDQYKSYLEEVSGTDFDAYFEDYVFGTKDLFEPLQECFNYLGCEIQTVDQENTLARDFGFKTTKASHKLTVVAIAEHAPAEAHLMLGDEIRSSETIDDSIVLEIIRKGEPLHIRFNKGTETYFPSFSLRKKEASETQKANFVNWLKQPF